MNSKVQRQVPGFTLVELLVALALVAAIVLLVYGSYAAATGAMDRYGRRMACSDRASLVLRLLARQLRCVYLPSSGTDTAPSPANTASATTNIAPIEPFETGEGTLSFVTTAGPDPAMALVRVLYQLDPASRTLSLSTEPYVSGGESSPDPGNSRPILTGVTALEVQFYDGRQWQTGWTAGVNQTLPQGIKIALSVVDEDSHELAFETMVPLGCHRAPPTQETATTAPTPGGAL